ncbi:hypothetical protein DKX38_005136 [Salix brachista]|uniref:F-box domain-containing protein n=1 Tax=Salix brachista TaxID=2182728 RepID=A0A5N5ND04_9ROSI|nr:hypothetical protein DKX38_005136 [Salix brachista]
MTRSIQTKQCGSSLDHNSEELEDKFSELPEDIILTIVEKIRDTKTLVICSVVSKQLHAVVSKIDAISVRILPYPRFHGRFECSESHNHLPPSQFPGLMRVFANVKHLNIRLCTFPTLNLRNPGNNLLMIKAMINGDDIRIDCCTAIKVGLLRRGMVEMMEMLFDPMLGQHPISYASDGFYGKKVSMTRKIRDLCSGKLFMTRKQLDDVTNLPPNSSVEGWLQDARNFAYKLKSSVNNGRSSRHELWHVTQWESFYTETGKIYIENPTASEVFVKELLGVAKDDDCDEKR